MNNNKIFWLSRDQIVRFGLAIRLELLVLLLILWFCPGSVFGQEDPQYDEVVVSMNVPGIGKADIPAVVKEQTAYFSIADVFNLIRIKNTLSPHLDSISGFFINLQDEYLIDKAKQQIVFQGKRKSLKADDLILTETGLYMRSNLFGEVFGLDCTFSFRDLTALLLTKLELPLIREMKLEQMRNNLKRLKGEVKTDTTIGRSYPFFDGGMVDWAVTSTQQEMKGPRTLVNLNAGSVVAGGEMSLRLNNWDPAQKFDISHHYYLWRFANNDFGALRQVSIGKFQPISLSRFNAPIIGAQISNTPTIYRRSFGTFIKTGTTKPDWQVELYVNNVLVNFVKADASGFYKFEIPLVYGNSVITIRSYGPWGEVETTTENANVPFAFLPSGELEYTVNGGVTDDTLHSKFYRATVNYGLSRKVSMGGGFEYFFSPDGVNRLPFVGTSMMPFNNLLVASEYTFGVQLKNSVSYRFPSNAQLEMSYTGYAKNQRVVAGFPVQQSGASLSIPFQRKNFSSFSMLSFNQMVYDSKNKFQTASFLFSGYFKGMSANMFTSVMFSEPSSVYATTKFSLSFNLSHQARIIPSVMYDYEKKRLTTAGCMVQKPLFKHGYLNLSYQHSYSGSINMFDLSFRYDFSFMQTSLDSHLEKDYHTFSQTASGSLMYDSHHRYMAASNTNSVGRSGLTFLAYLDLNGNGKREPNEPRVAGLNVRVNGGRVIKSEKDSTVRIIDLQPYTSYLVELDKNNFKSLSWRINKLKLNVYADPNQFKTIEIPVEVVAEAAGTVNLKTPTGTKGLGRAYVDFYRNGKTLVGKVLTEEDGYFSFMGLLPGEYQARIDSIQMVKINMLASPGFKSFTVKSSSEGDFVEGLDFELVSTSKDVPGSKAKSEPADSAQQKIIHYAKLKEEQNANVLKERGFVQNQQGVSVAGKAMIQQVGQIRKTLGQWYAIWVGVYAVEADAIAVQANIFAASGRPVLIEQEKSLYSVWIEGFENHLQAEQYLAKLDQASQNQNVSRSNQLASAVGLDSKRAGAANSPNRLTSAPKQTTPANTIHYGPWKMEKQIRTKEDSTANFFTYEKKGPIQSNPNIEQHIAMRKMEIPEPVKTEQVAATLASQSAVKQIQAEVVSQLKTFFSIQAGEYVFAKSAGVAMQNISVATNQPVKMVSKNGFYQLWVEGFRSRKEARRFVDKLNALGFNCTIVKVSGNQTTNSRDY